MAGDDRPDLCVIGGGAAGHAVALAAAALGARCTLVDPTERLGRGQAADVAEAMFLREAIGRRPGERFNWPDFRRRLGRALAADHANHTAARLATLGVTVIRGTARFTDARTIRVNDRAIRARRFILAAGALPHEPGWARAPTPALLLRPADLLACETLPPAITIVASVPAGLAWAQALARIGTAVTLRLEPDACSAFDPELLQPVLEALRQDGVDYAIATTASTGRPAGAFVLLVSGRPVPATAALGLPEAGIACLSGAPTVNRRFRTTNARVYALGEVLGPDVASRGSTAQQVSLVLRTALFRLPLWTAPPPAPLALRTDPAIAQVGRLAAPGLSLARAPTQPERSAGPMATAIVTTLVGVSRHSAETQPVNARAAGPENGRLVLRYPLAEVMPGLPGLVKVVASRSGRILGAGIVGPGALEAIAPWVLAMARGVPVGLMADTPVPAGTLAEAGRRAALSLVAQRLRGPWVKRLIVVLRRLP